MTEPRARKTGSLVVRRPAFDSQDFEPILIDLFEHCLTAEHNLTSEPDGPTCATRYSIQRGRMHRPAIGRCRTPWPIPTRRTICAYCTLMPETCTVASKSS